MLNGILWILSTGAPWADLPDRYPSYQTCHRRFQQWSAGRAAWHRRNPRSGTPRRRPFGSTGRVHRWERRTRPSREALASARRNAAKDRRSWPSPIVRGFRSPSTWRAPRARSHAGARHTHGAVCQSTPDAPHGDNVYESDRLDSELARLGVELIAPHRRTRTQRTQDGRPLHRYQRRWKIERLFAWFQKFRRIVVRYERFPENFLGMLHLASCLTLLRGL